MSKKIGRILRRLNKFRQTHIHKKILILMKSITKKFMIRLLKKSKMISMPIKLKLWQMMLKFISLKLNRSSRTLIRMIIQISNSRSPLQQWWWAQLQLLSRLKTQVIQRHQLLVLDTSKQKMVQLLQVILKASIP